MSEMEDTADHLIVIGRGRLIADVPMSDLLGRTPPSGCAAPWPPCSPGALERAGARIDVLADGALWVEGMDVVEVGDVAFLSGLRVHELTQVTESLEEAYLALTEDEVEFRAVSRVRGRTVSRPAAQRVDQAAVDPLDLVVRRAVPPRRRAAPAGWPRRAPTRPRSDIALGVALTGFGIGQLVVLVLGVLAVTTEFSSGMALVSFDRGAPAHAAAARQDARSSRRTAPAHRRPHGGLRRRRRYAHEGAGRHGR